jgi:F0F1-type ATP synthase assembly protein I
MPPDPETPGEKKDRPFGFGRLPQSFDLALRWALTLAIAVLLGVLIGHWLDAKLHTTPVFLLIGVFWGLGGSFYSLYLQVKKLQEKEESPNGPAGG